MEDGIIYEDDWFLFGLKLLFQVMFGNENRQFFLYFNIEELDMFMFDDLEDELCLKMLCGYVLCEKIIFFN